MRKSGIAVPDTERYRLLVDAITDYAVYMLDAEGYVTSWNPGAQRFKGYSESEILGRHFSDFYTEEDKAKGLPRHALATAAEQGRFENEGWRIRKDGTRFWAHVVIDPIRDRTGKLIGFAKITRDLTERMVAQQALRRSQEQFRLLVEGVTDYAIYMLDPEGRVSSWNTGAQRIKGYAPQEILGEHFSRFYTEEDRQAGLPQHGLQTAAREGRFEKEGWRLRKDGTRFWANVVIDAIRDENGVLIGFAKVTRDFTERREAQQELERAREALFQSQKMEAVGRLTGGIAHDFNNLLMAVLGSLELLRKRVPQDPKIASLLDNAIQGAKRGATLTQRMLAFARRQELKLERVDLPDLVRGMSGLLQRTIDPSIGIETRFPLGLPVVQSDPSQLESALLNLVVNARDAMPEGGKITITGRSEHLGEGNAQNLNPGDYVCFSVSDTGEGMDEATIASAVEPFFTTKGVGKGTGLGLPMVQGLTEQSGGRLYLKSEKGMGTTVELWLPVAPTEPPVAEPAEIDMLETADPHPQSRSYTVLAVDDDALVLMNTEAMLEDLGHNVLSAGSGQEALEIVRNNENIDLVVSDQAMPQMTGTQLAEALKALRPELPVVLATGYAELPAGIGAQLPRLSKPFSQQQLAIALESAMQPQEAGKVVPLLRSKTAKQQGERSR